MVAQDYDHDGVNQSRQRTAVAPNFVHSLDSTHMLMTAITCQARFPFVFVRAFTENLIS